jgi:hypothetical protein
MMFRKFGVSKIRVEDIKSYIRAKTMDLGVVLWKLDFTVFYFWTLGAVFFYVTRKRQVSNYYILSR